MASAQDAIEATIESLNARRRRRSVDRRDAARRTRSPSARPGAPPHSSAENRHRRHRVKSWPFAARSLQRYAREERHTDQRFKWFTSSPSPPQCNRHGMIGAIRYASAETRMPAPRISSRHSDKQVVRQFVACRRARFSTEDRDISMRLEFLLRPRPPCFPPAPPTRKAWPRSRSTNGWHGRGSPWSTTLVGHVFRARQAHQPLLRQGQRAATEIPPGAANLPGHRSPCFSAGRDMERASRHGRFHRDFNALVQDLGRTLDKFKVPARSRKSWWQSWRPSRGTSSSTDGAHALRLAPGGARQVRRCVSGRTVLR